jgi:hypothetical protein
VRHGEDAPLLLIKQRSGLTVTPCGDWLLVLQSQSSASPPGCPSGPLLGVTFPSTRVHGRYTAKRPGSDPVSRLNARLAARGTEVPPHGANANTPHARRPRSSCLLLAASGQVQACSHHLRCEQGPGVRCGVPDTQTKRPLACLFHLPSFHSNAQPDLRKIVGTYESAALVASLLPHCVC